MVHNQNNHPSGRRRDFGDDGVVPTFKVSVVVPVYREPDEIGRALTRLSRFLRNSGWRAEVLVIDDGSEDGTSEAAVRWKGYFDQMKVMRHGKRKGRGTAVRTGTLLASGRHILIFDPRGETPLENARHLIESLEQGAELAIASRKLRGATIQTGNFLDRASESTFTVLSKLLVPIGARQTNSDLIAFERSVGRHIAQRARVRGDAWCHEWLALASRAGVHLVELPIGPLLEDTGVRRGRPNELAMLCDVWRLRRRLDHADGPRPAAAHDLLHETSFVRVDQRVLMGKRRGMSRRAAS